MNRLPIIFLLGLIVMFELIPSIAVAMKLFSLPTSVSALLSLLVGIQIATAIFAGSSIIMLWKNCRYSKLFTLIIQYIVIAIPLMYISMLILGFYSYYYRLQGMLFLLTFTSGVAAFLAFINIVVMGISLKNIEALKN